MYCMNCISDYKGTKKSAKPSGGIKGYMAIQARKQGP